MTALGARHVEAAVVPAPAPALPGARAAGDQGGARHGRPGRLPDGRQARPAEGPGDPARRRRRPCLGPGPRGARAAARVPDRGGGAAAGGAAGADRQGEPAGAAAGQPERRRGSAPGDAEPCWCPAAGRGSRSTCRRRCGRGRRSSPPRWAGSPRWWATPGCWCRTETSARCVTRSDRVLADDDLARALAEAAARRGGELPGEERALEAVLAVYGASEAGDMKIPTCCSRGRLMATEQGTASRSWIRRDHAGRLYWRG